MSRTRVEHGGAVASATPVATGPDLEIPIGPPNPQAVVGQTPQAMVGQTPQALAEQHTELALVGVENADLQTAWAVGADDPSALTEAQREHLSGI